MTRGRRCLATALVAGLLPLAPAVAQSGPAGSDDAGPAGNATPLRTIWRHALVLGMNDNLSLLPSGTLGSPFLALLPAWQATHESARQRLQLQVKAELLRYTAHSAFNTDNSELSIDGLHALTAQRAAAWRVTVQDWHDPVGTSSLARPDGEPDHFVAAAGGAVFRQDFDGGNLRIETEVSASRKQYQNHRAVTRLGDVATQGLVLRWQPSSARGLRWLNELRWVQAHYPFQIAALDHSDLRLTTGWMLEPATGRADGEGNDTLASGWLADPFQIRFGLQRLQFDRLRPDTLAPTWELQAGWRLSSTQRLEVGGGLQRGVAPGDGADHVSTRQWRSTWVLDPAPGWRSTLGWSGTVLRYVYGGFADGSPRIDRSQTWEAGVRRVTATGMTLTFSHAHSLRRSSEDGFDFARRLTTFSVEWPV